MLTVKDIENVSFRKARGTGYKPEDVDEFIDQVAESYDLLIKKSVEQKEQIDTLTEENERLQTAVETLKEQQQAPAPQQPEQPKPVVVEDVKLSEECEYTQEEIKNALLSAQKLANATIREARQKAETILGEANTKAERIVGVAQGEVNEQKEELERLKKLVSDFRASLLDKYKEHLKLVNALPTHKSGETTQVPAVKPEKAAKPEPEQFPVEEPTREAPKSEPKFNKKKKNRAPQEGNKAETAAPNLADIAKKEEMSQTKSFQLGSQLDDTGEFSELKFGADYDITKE